MVKVRYKKAPTSSNMVDKNGKALTNAQANAVLKQYLGGIPVPIKATTKKKKRGRPLGSKNKPKPLIPAKYDQDNVILVNCANPYSARTWTFVDWSMTIGAPVSTFKRYSQLKAYLQEWHPKKRVAETKTISKINKIIENNKAGSDGSTILWSEIRRLYSEKLG